MNIKPNLQKNLYGFNDIFLNFKTLIEQNKLPNKILLSGQKGIGKCTFAYHLSNYILSINEVNSYDFQKKIINSNNRSFNLVSTNIHPNFYMINLKDEKKSIEISQIREMINFTNMSSFDNGYKIVLIDNVEDLNLNSVNALLKIIEEPNDKVIFFLIHDIQKIIFDTLKSRCIQFKLNLTEHDKSKIINSLTEENFSSKINNDFVHYYNSPGEYINFYYFCIENDIDFKNTNIENFIKLIFNDASLKKNNFIKNNLNNYLEYFFLKKINLIYYKDKFYDLYKYFFNKFYNAKKYNLDFEPLLIEFDTLLLNE